MNGETRTELSRSRRALTREYIEAQATIRRLRKTVRLLATRNVRLLGMLGEDAAAMRRGARMIRGQQEYTAAARRHPLRWAIREVWATWRATL